MVSEQRASFKPVPILLQSVAELRYPWRRFRPRLFFFHSALAVEHLVKHLPSSS